MLWLFQQKTFFIQMISVWIWTNFKLISMSISTKVATLCWRMLWSAHGIIAVVAHPYIPSKLERAHLSDRPMGWTRVCFHNLCVRAAEAPASQRMSAGLPKPLLLANAISTNLSWDGFCINQITQLKLWQKSYCNNFSNGNPVLTLCFCSSLNWNWTFII